MSTERAALLRAILDDPADLDSRRIFADYLEEHGDEADRMRALAIRCDMLPPSEYRFDKLRWNRIDKHATGYWTNNDLLAMLFDGVPCIAGVELTLYMGFVSRIKLPLPEWKKHGPALMRRQPIELVELSQVNPAHNYNRNLDPFRERQGWYRATHYNKDGDDVPACIWDFLKAGRIERPWRWYGDEPAGAAEADLSQACLQWAKNDIPNGTPLVRESNGRWREARPGETADAVMGAISEARSRDFGPR